MSAVLAFDIGGTKLAAGVVDHTGTALSFASAPTRVHEGPAAVIERLFELGHRTLLDSGVDLPRVEAVGIGCGGPLDNTKGLLLAPPHLPGWRDVPIVEQAEQAFQLPAVLDNDGTAAAAGEHRFGAGVGSRFLVYLTLSTGVGGGAVLDGRTYRGATGNGAELGHITVDRDGRICHSCGRRGCLEAYVSGTSIAERAVEAMAGGEPTTLPDAAELTALDVQRAAAAGDRLAAAVWAETAAVLGSGLTSIVNVFEPELVVLGGGVSRAGEQLIGPAREIVRQCALGPAAESVRIVPAGLGDRVGVIGAAAIAFERRDIAADGAAGTSGAETGAATHG